VISSYKPVYEAICVKLVAETALRPKRSLDAVDRGRARVLGYESAADLVLRKETP
jgi:hypothetical protein